MALHSMCHPGLPWPHGLSQLFSPGFAACKVKGEKKSDYKWPRQNVMSKLFSSNFIRLPTRVWFLEVRAKTNRFGLHPPPLTFKSIFKKITKMSIFSSFNRNIIFKPSKGQSQQDYAFEGQQLHAHQLYCFPTSVSIIGHSWETFQHQRKHLPQPHMHSHCW